MTDDVLYSLWISECFSFIPRKREEFYPFSNPKEIFMSDDGLLKASLKSQIYSKIQNKDLSNALKIFSDCEKYGIKVLTPRMDEYPKRLLSIENPPEALFVRGDVNCFNSQRSAAVIGSRTASKYGEDFADLISYSLSEIGTVIVSGGAVGIDSVAHRAAIRQGGKTILVMGCGHGYPYLPENSSLRKSVCENGATISEYPPFYGITRGSFPSRNRLISGLGDGVVIVEAALRSGSLNTVSHAKRQKRKILVLPGDVKSGNFDGSNELVKNGATAVFSFDDVLQGLGYGADAPKYYSEKNIVSPFLGIEETGIFSKEKSSEEEKVSAEKTQEPEIKPKEKEELFFPSEYSKTVYGIMSKGILNLDDIIKNTDYETKTVLTALTELELFGHIKTEGPNCYKLT